MKEFKMIKQRVIEESEKNTADTVFYIENGYFPTWAVEHRTDVDRGLKANSTETRWEQYKSGKISREKAVELATKRAIKQIEKKTDKKLTQLDCVLNAPDLTFISVSVRWVRSQTWGYNPHADIRTNTGFFEGSASGCGYDKESTAVANAFNKCNTILKELYTLKEKGLNEGKTNKSNTTCTGVNNRYICGYGSGYSVLPYFEGGVGVSCFWEILKKCGFKIQGQHTKYTDYYYIEKEG